MSRKELSRTPFEQIKLSENTLFKECGNIKRGRFYATEQEVTFVTVTQRDRLDSLAAELRIYLKTHTFRPERPGDNSSLFDPGRLSLSVEYKDGETVSFETSLDSVSNASRGSEKRIKKLVSALRGAAGGILCGRKEFFGIGS
ncbi:MAG: hypothetical protein D6719_01875 [Candidatus Dadabacteria bacterium]|nr:MAG: hypothetical protein D6719_01875 [Candidatus Dadabacteria bacterium]